MSQLDEGSQASQLDDDFQASNDASMGSTASGMTEQLELLPSDATNPDASAQQHSSPNASTSGTPDTILSRVEQISGTISQHCRGVPRKAREAMRAQYSSSNDDDPLGGDGTPSDSLTRFRISRSCRARGRACFQSNSFTSGSSSELLSISNTGAMSFDYDSLDGVPSSSLERLRIVRRASYAKSSRSHSFIY